MIRRAVRIADVNPRWWMRVAYLLLMAVVLVVAVLGDRVPVVASALVLVTATAASVALNRSDRQSRRKAEMAANLARWEQGDDPIHYNGDGIG